MELYLDTADIEAIKRLGHSLPLAGVTTNPSIIAKAGQPIWQILPQIREALGGKGRLFAQVMAATSEQMVAEAHKLRQCIDDIVIKIPVTPEGLAAIKQLTALNIPTLGTTVYGAGQGLFAALAGAHYVAPYVNRLDAQGGDGIEMVNELQLLLSQHAPQAKVLAASFRTPRQALECLLVGCQAITLPVEIAELFIQTPAVQAAIEQFESDWYSVFATTDLVT